MDSQQFSRTSLAFGAGLVLAGQALAHGYISTPESRGLLCRSGGNSNCGAVQWEPQSLEAPSGFPDRGPADGSIASANLAQFSPLDEQTSSRWTKRPISAGPQTFSWTLTANHVARNYRYYITKQGWNPNTKLTRAAFENQPFCVADAGMRQPPKLVSHTCAVPQRTGYQIILGVWEIGDTPNSFYNVADVQFQNGSTPPTIPTWSAKGMLYPSVDLQAGDKVATRVFDASGERPELQTRVIIGNATDGERNTWPFLLATRINAEQPNWRAGQMATDGSIAPARGQNEVFVSKDSTVNRIEVQIDKAPTPPGVDLLISGLAGQYPIANGQAALSFSLTAVGDMDVSATLFDKNGQTKGMTSTTLNNSGLNLRLVVEKAQAGVYQLVIKGAVKGSGALIQKTYELNLVGGGPVRNFEYKFPDGIKSYKAGTRVLQPENGAVYECKPWPQSGYCVQWSPSASQFEPGTGRNWQDAWIAR